jgi:hypothetical protein
VGGRRKIFSIVQDLLGGGDQVMAILAFEQQQAPRFKRANVADTLNKWVDIALTSMSLWLGLIPSLIPSNPNWNETVSLVPKYIFRLLRMSIEKLY